MLWESLATRSGEGNGTPLQYSCLESPTDRGAWWAAVHGVAESRTRLSTFTCAFHFHALEKEMATHSIVLAWRIPGTGEPGGLPSMGLHRVGHNWSDLAAAAAATRRGFRRMIHYVLKRGKEGRGRHTTKSTTAPDLWVKAPSWKCILRPAIPVDAMGISWAFPVFLAHTIMKNKKMSALSHKIWGIVGYVAIVNQNNWESTKSFLRCFCKINLAF